MEASVQRSSLLSTLQHGLRVLDELALEGMLTAKELAERIGLGVRTTYNVLNTLEQKEYVVHFSNGKYGLGARIAFLQCELGGYLTPADTILQALAELYERTGESVSVNGWFGNDIVVQRYIHGHSRFGDPPIGAGFRGWSTSRCTVKAILAFLSEKRLRYFLASHRQERTAAGTVVELTPFKTGLKEIVLRGYALDLAETSALWYGVAVPFFNGRGFPIGSLSISSSPSHFRASEFCQDVMVSAERLSAELGYRGAYPPPSPLFAGGRSQRVRRAG